MKRIVVLLAALCGFFSCLAQVSFTRPNIENCIYTLETDEGFSSSSWEFGLWGDVQVVSDPKKCDLLVYVVKEPGAAQLYVERVATSAEANDCGKWHFVSSNPKFKIYYLPKDLAYQADVVICFVGKGEHGCRY